MNKSDLTNWAIETFWPAYKGLVKTPFPTQYGAGTRGDAVSKILSMKPSDELRKRIIDAVFAQMAHRRDLFNKCGSMQKYNAETAKVEFYCNRNGKTWLNQLGYEDEIPSVIDEKKVYEDAVLKCSTTGCNNQAIGGHINTCQACESKVHDPYREEKRDYLRAYELTMSKDESMHDYAMRCKAHAFSIMPNIRG